MSQELTSAKYFQQPSTEEIQAYEKQAVASSNWLLAAKSSLYLVLLVAVLGGGGYMVFNGVRNANRQHSWSGHGGHPAMAMMSYCMGLFYLDWDDQVEREIEISRPEELPDPDVPVISNLSATPDFGT